MSRLLKDVVQINLTTEEIVCPHVLKELTERVENARGYVKMKQLTNSTEFVSRTAQLQ